MSWGTTPPAATNRELVMSVKVKATELIPTRATLIERLKDLQSRTSWQEFFDIYWRLIYCVARKVGLTEVEAQDAVQETFVAVAKHIPTFQYNPALGSFKTWLLNMTRWRITDQFRKRGPFSQHHQQSGGRSETGTATIEAVPDPSGGKLDELWESEWQETLLEGALAKVKRGLDPQKYQIFDCLVNKKWPPSKVAATFCVPTAQVYVIKHRITQLIRQEVKRLEKEVT